MATLRDKGNVSLHLGELLVLSRFRTARHEGVIYRHPQLGRVLALNGEIQHVEVWAPLYHEPLVHLAAAFVEKPKTALLLGGGSFFAVQELLKYRSIKRILMLDFDKQLLDRVIEHYHHAQLARQDPRLEIRICDAFEELPTIDDRFDLVINDSIDLMRDRGSGVAAMSRLLRPDGVCSDVIYRHIFEEGSLTDTIQLLRDNYQNALSLIFAAEYPGILHLLTLWSFSQKLSQTKRKSVNLEHGSWARSPSSNPCSYFDPRFLSYYLHLPFIVRNQLT